MKASVNRALLEQTSFDSARPSGTATVVHRFPEEGRFAVALRDDDDREEMRTILVEPARGPAGEQAHAAAFPEGVLVDVASRRPEAGRPNRPQPSELLSLGAGGYASFTAPPGQGRRVVVTRISAAGEREDEVFDSSRLRASDTFAVTLLRPGTYLMRDTVGRAEGKVVVTYPEVGRVPYRPAEPVTVTCDDGGFSPATVTVGPGQGIVVTAGADCRVTVDLVEPDDGPGGGSGGRRPPRRPVARRQLRPHDRREDG